MRKIYLASDHAGFELKEKLKNFLKEKSLNFTINDCGSYKYDLNDDYPDFISKAAEKISNNWNNTCKEEKDLAIIFGGSGQGEAIVANKFSNVRAIVYYAHNSDILKLSKKHNNANTLSIGARFFKENDEKRLFKDIFNWIKLDFSKEQRHIRRILKINKISKNIISS